MTTYVDDTLGSGKGKFEKDIEITKRVFESRER